MTQKFGKEPSDSEICRFTERNQAAMAWLCRLAKALPSPTLQVIIDDCQVQLFLWVDIIMNFF